MEKSIFEQLGITYRKVGKYLLPDINLPQENKPIGAWGRRHHEYLKNEKRVLYSQLLISGKLNDHLADIDRQAEEMYHRLMNELAGKDGITEQLKSDDQMEWVRRMNAVQAQVNAPKKTVCGSCCDRRNDRKEAQKSGMVIWSDDRGEKSAE